MEGLGSLLLFAAFFYFMMRFGCGAHMVHGHGHSHGSKTDVKHHDSVCGMEVDMDKGYSKMHEGTLYRFCSRSCLDKFEADPECYLKQLKEIVMKKMITLAMASALFLPQLSLYADESHHPEKQGPKDEVQTQAKPARGGMMGEMEEHMQKMMRQMDEIHNTGDPVEREKLLQEHMQSRREGMDVMCDMGGGMMEGMMDDGGSGGMMMGKGMHRGSEKTGCDEKGVRHRQMEKRMDTMQMMMEHMMQH